ncbi:MAG: cysteine desulfurase-like protein [Rhodothermales bacterium]|nr:cysteine desulfurase-like protein [Rhodothermales bacterium]
MKSEAEILARTRNAFPALRRMHNGFPVAYFDGPGGTQVPTYVVDAMADYLYNHNANTHWNFPTSNETDAALQTARNSVAVFLNCLPSEVAFGANMTTLTFHVARSIGRGLEAGDEILVTELDHHANIAPWTALASERGVVIRTAKMDPRSGQLDWGDLTEKLTTKTKVLAIGAASNALGTITDVQEATRFAHEHGTKVFVDAVHYAPHHLPDVRRIGCDYLACSAYKFYGPHVGILFGKQHELEHLDVPKLAPAPDTVPERIETGTLNHEGIVGTGAAIDFLAALTKDGKPVPATRDNLEDAFAFLHETGAILAHQLWDGLNDIPGVTTYGPAPGNQAHPRTPTVSCTVAGHSAASVCRRLADKGLFVSDGNFYAATVVERLGVEGLVRIGCACYTSFQEIERIVEAIHEIASSKA